MFWTAVLAALDQETGKEVWSVKTAEDDYHSITGAPRVVKGKVIIGNGGAEFGVRGYVSAYDARTGKMAWRFYTVPGDPLEAGREFRLAESAGNMEGRGLLESRMRRHGVGRSRLRSASGSAVRRHRQWLAMESRGSQSRRRRQSLSVQHPRTQARYRALVWHYQTTPGESWDFTATQSLILADLSIKGRDRKVIMQAPKNGFFYVLDRITGELLSAEAFTDVNWATGIDMNTGRPIETPNARYVAEPALIWVAGGGAHSWQPMAYSPQTKLAYIPGANGAFSFAQDPDYKYQRGRQNFGAAFTRAAERAESPRPARIPGCLGCRDQQGSAGVFPIPGDPGACWQPAGTSCSTVLRTDG